MASILEGLPNCPERLRIQNGNLKSLLKSLEGLWETPRALINALIAL